MTFEDLVYGRAKNLTVLEVGCGVGNATLKLRKKGVEALGFDIDLARIAMAKEQAKIQGFSEEIFFHVTEAGNLPIGDSKIRLIFSDQVVEHVKDMSALVVELSRVAAPGCVWINRFPSRWNVFEPHTGIAFAHWVPFGRNRLLSNALAGNADAWSTEGERKVRLDDLVRYLKNATRYRSRSDLIRIFLKSGWTVDFLDFETVDLRVHNSGKIPALLGQLFGARTEHTVMMLSRP